MTTPSAADLIEQIRDYARQLPAPERTPGRLEVGSHVQQRLTEIAHRAPAFNLPPLPALYGLPVALNDSLLPGEWRLLNVNGDVMREGAMDCRIEWQP